MCSSCKEPPSIGKTDPSFPIDSFIVYCDNQKCNLMPSTIGFTKAEAILRWNNGGNGKTLGYIRPQ